MEDHQDIPLWDIQVDPEDPPAADAIRDYPQPGWWIKDDEETMMPHVAVDMFKASKAAVAFLRHQQETEDIIGR